MNISLAHPTMDVLNEDWLPQVAIPDGRKVLSSPFGDLHAETSPNKRPRSNQKLFKSSLTNFSALKGDISINSTRSEPYSITLRCENIDDSNYFLTSNLSQQFHQHSTGTMTSQDMFRPQWLNESHVTAISRSKSFSHVQPKTAPSFSFSRHVQTPKLYFDSKYSRMYTKLVSQKLVLVSHPYDLPFSDKTTDKMGNMKSPFELHSDLNSHRNVSLPGPTQQWKTESRFDKVEYLQHSDWLRSSRIPLHSQESQKSNSAEGQNDNNKYFVPISARRAKTSHSFPSKMPKNRPLQISTELLSYYSQLIDTKTRDHLPSKDRRDNLNLVQMTALERSATEFDLGKQSRKRIQKTLRFQEPSDQVGKTERKMKILSQLNLKTEQSQVLTQ